MPPSFPSVPPPPFRTRDSSPKLQTNINGVDNPFIRTLSTGPKIYCNTYPAGYYVNSYKFHIEGYGGSRATANSGVCIKVTNFITDDSDYYGVLEEVVELEYPSFHGSKVILFKCRWLKNSEKGTRIHLTFKLVEVNQRRKLDGYDPFVLAIQATHVYYCKRPGPCSDWMYVCKVKSRSLVDASVQENINPTGPQEDAFQEDDIEAQLNAQIDVDHVALADENGAMIDIGSC